MLTFITILGVILFVFLVYLLIKDCLVKFKLSENGFKNALYVIIILFGIFFSFSMYLNSNEVNELKVYYEASVLNKSLDEKELDEVQKRIIQCTKNSKKYSLYALIDLGIVLVVRSNIKKERAKLLEEPKKRWSDIEKEQDLDKE
ncbi:MULTISPECIES: hypothetical protein [Clostridium]|uniref:LMBR1 domain-containing protein n=1 Tax=Clostridium senegalense TaxID=1465809 RepID=A0A6M0H5A6_9CLOT|nr:MULTISPECIES: hypothetical protein [Clostridium]NEU05916.1 LMBR1 domain-containing protein [Clostridium senegalense]